MAELKKPGNARSNAKTALILASVALVFFASVFVKRLWLS
jgi:hypothetical protein